MEKQEKTSRFNTALSLITLLLIYFILLSKFNISLLFSDTILTGGDSASWYQVLHTLKYDYLPKGWLFGFSQGNFFGYMEGQHYFVLPFLFAALLGSFMPLTVALKITTVLGGFALPLTVYAGVLSISGSKRSASVSAAASLLFLFNESYSIFGGNWLSTFAGEFCFSWAIAMLPLFVASVVRDAREKRSGLASGILLGLIGLAHLFVFMPAFFLPFFSAFGTLPELLGRRRTREGQGRSTTARILVTYASAFLVMAFWLLPMVATRQWAQPISIIWRFASFGDFVSQTCAPVWIGAALLFIFAAIKGKKGSQGKSLGAFFAYGLGACAFLFFVAPGLGMPDIRFIPTALVLCVVGIPCVVEMLADPRKPRAAEEAEACCRGDHRGERRGDSRSGDNRPRGAGRIDGYRDRPPSIPLLRRNALLSDSIAFLLILVFCWVSARSAKNSPSWYTWNYSGYEAKSEWPAMQELSRKYDGSADSGRFLWEKQDQHDNGDFGSERAFENLPLFTGYPTSEGINYGSSMMARAATYLQSSYSANPVDPEAERIYSTIDPESWPARFSLLNARYIVTHSDAITALFKKSPFFALDSTVGKFSVFRFVGFRKSYVEIISPGSLHLVGEGPGGFKSDYYRFFRDYELYGEPFVSRKFADTALRESVPELANHDSYDSYRYQVLPQTAVGLRPEDQGSVRNEHVDNFSISFDTERPGQPHYIKISFAPGWRSVHGEKLYPVSPGFMLIIPRSAHVELHYSRTTPEWFGAALSLLFLPFAAAVTRAWRKRGRTKIKKSGVSRQSKLTGAGFSRGPSRGGAWKIVIGLAMLVFLATATTLIIQTERGYPALVGDIGEARRQNLATPAGRARAKALVERWAIPENLDRYDNMLSFDAFKIKAKILQVEGKNGEAAELLDMLRNRYPHTRAVQTLSAR